MDSLDTLQSTLQDLATSLSIDGAGLLRSTYPEEAELIENANDILQDDSVTYPDCRLFLLRDLIYTRIYLAPHPESEAVETKKQYENSLSGGVKSNFFQRLHRQNSGTGYADPDWEIIGFETDGSIKVQKEGLMLWVKPKKHLFNPLSDETIGDLIQIRLPQNALEPGIYIAIGNAGKVQPGRSTRSVSQIHMNFNAIHAPDVMGYWTTAMNDLGLPFCFAVGHESDNYDRADPGILVFYKETIAQVLELLQQFLDQHSSQLRRGVPILTKQIGPGLGYSECPKGETPLSFHLHRCQLIAQGLIEAWEHNQDAIASIIQCFERQNLSLSTPYLNPGAQDFQWVIEYG